MFDRDGPVPPSGREVAGEDFLFHLYRGSEMLQDNRVIDAKAELEQALRLQPSDPKGQDLLGVVYFRLGLYPRAIAIYEKLIVAFPDAIEPRINLALSYLKTGQPTQARAELERVVEQNPSHSRAWGYLGLAFQRMGDYERASHAFAAGGHDAMARRLLDMAMAQAGGNVTAPPSLAPPPAEEIWLEAAAGPVPADVADPVASPVTQPWRSDWPAIGGWSETSGGNVPPSPVAPGDTTNEAANEALGAAAAPDPTPAPASVLLRPPAVPAHMSAAPPSVPAARPPVTPPLSAAEALRSALLVPPRDLQVGLHSSGAVLVRATHGFAVRLNAVRSALLGAPWGAPLPRRVRGRPTEEALGGADAPLLELTGKPELVLGAAAGARLVPVTLGEDPWYVREDAVQGFDLSVSYESGRLPLGDGDAIAMMQLRGPGVVIVSVPEMSHAVEMTEGRQLVVRAASVTAWLGRLLPRALFAAEAPAGTRGFVAFTGEGMVWLDGRQ